jgi:mRNA interferase MazF
MLKGTVVLVPFPFTDLSGQKVRPCLVLHTQQESEDCILTFLSSIKTKSLHAFDIRVKATAKNGLKTDSILKTNKIATLQKKIILGELGKLEEPVMKIVEKKLKHLFKLA